MAKVKPATRFTFSQDDGTPYQVDVPKGRTYTLIPKNRGSGASYAIGAMGLLTLSRLAKDLISAERGSAARLGGLDEANRASLRDKDFAVPLERKYPIHDKWHGQLALVYIMSPSNERYRYQVMSRVFHRYPDLINWWASTEKGLQAPLTEQLFRDEIRKYRRNLSSAKTKQEAYGIENELSALQLLVTMTPRLKQLAAKSASRIAQ